MAWPLSNDGWVNLLLGQPHCGHAGVQGRDQEHHITPAVQLRGCQGVIGELQPDAECCFLQGGTCREEEKC